MVKLHWADEGVGFVAIVLSCELLGPNPSLIVSNACPCDTVGRKGSLLKFKQQKKGKVEATQTKLETAGGFPGRVILSS